MAEKGYLIGEGVRRKLKETFAKVDAIPYRGGSAKIPVDHSGLTLFPQEPHYLSKTTAAWDKETSQTLTIWVGEPGSEEASDSAGDTVEAWNKIADVASGMWVIVGRINGTFYLLAYAEDSDSACKSKIGSLDLSDISGYDASKTQVLSHDTSGCLAWLNTTDCET